jgi:hypothetical protein
VVVVGGDFHHIVPSIQSVWVDGLTWSWSIHHALPVLLLLCQHMHARYIHVHIHYHLASASQAPTWLSGKAMKDHWMASRSYSACSILKTKRLNCCCSVSVVHGRRGKHNTRRTNQSISQSGNQSVDRSIH